MYKIAKPLLLKCETPLHAGSGSDLSIVDLPIQRERHTGFPKIEGSSLKGAFREHFRAIAPDVVTILFGSESDDENRKAGSLGLTDARLLLFPVRSVKGLFAWITCPQALNRAAKDFSICNLDGSIFEVTGEDLVIENSPLVINGKVILEEFVFNVSPSKKLKELAEILGDVLFKKDEEYLKYWNDKIKNSVVVLSDDDFREFVNLSTEVITRTKIDPEKGTVADGALFTEEYLPIESILYSLIFGSNEFLSEDPQKHPRMEADSVFEKFEENLKKNSNLQIGGNASLGKGLVSTYFMK